MKILITGSEGFIGKNLVTHFLEVEGVEILRYDRGVSFEYLEENIKDVDHIVHLAGVNRPKSTEEFYSGNTDLTQRLIDLLKSKNLKIPIIYTSSVQAALDNDYGKSKKRAEDIILGYGNGSLVYRLHNVFGKWCRPNYNSVVATFCHNIATGQDIFVDDRRKEIELIYIDDIAYEFKKIILGGAPSDKQNGFCFVNPRYKVSLGYLADTLKQFKEEAQNIYVPATGDDFIKKLHATFVTYLPPNELVASTSNHVDNRGNFVELIRTRQIGQVSVSITKPGIVRGNHYHHTKIERFMVVKGRAQIRLSSVLNSTANYYLEVNDSAIQIVTIPPGYTHSIENVGKTDMVMVIWCNELFDENIPDTYFKEVKIKNAKKITEGDKIEWQN